MTPQRTPEDPGRSSGSAAAEPDSSGRHVLVVGGGISGLAAAWYLAATDPMPAITVLEAAPRLGGKLSVSEVAGIPVDEGPEWFVASRPEAVQLARDVGLETDLVAPAELGAGVVSRGRVRPVPRGQFMGIPTDLRALGASQILSMRGLLRMPLDRTLPATDFAEDISVGALVGTRVGREVVERLVDPLLAGVYGGRADDLSMAATMPVLLREMRHERSLLTATRRIAGGGMGAAGARRGIPFRGIAGGVGRVPGAMAAALVGAGVQIRTRCTVRRLHQLEGRRWQVELGPASSPELLTADAVVLAVPAAPAARLLADVAPGAAMELSEVESASVAIVALAFPADRGSAPLPGSGVMVPAVEGRIVRAVSHLDRKWGWVADAAAASGLRMVRVTVGRHGEADVLQRADDELVALARLDLAQLLGLRGTPVDARVTRWGGAFPQYAVGHRRRVERVMAGLRDAPTLAVCGASYEGVGVAACIATAFEAAQRVGRGLAVPTAGGVRG